MEDAFRGNSLPVVAGIFLLVAWLMTERLMQLFGLRQRGQPIDRETMSSYWHTFAFYGAIVFPMLDAAILHWTSLPSTLQWLMWAGIPLVVAGIGIRLAARASLGQQFSGHVQTNEHHQLVTSGLYRFVRHPAYLGYLLLLLGFPMTFGSIAGLAAALLIGIPALAYRIRVEENALGQWFPDQYPAYCAKTRRLIPFVW